MIGGGEGSVLRSSEKIQFVQSVAKLQAKHTTLFLAVKVVQTPLTICCRFASLATARKRRGGLDSYSPISVDRGFSRIKKTAKKTPWSA